MTEDTTMAEPVQGEPIEYLVSRRSRRSTAGNRMEAALAEMALDTNMETVEDDQDFVNEKGTGHIAYKLALSNIFAIDEEDVFGSDFASTDEEEMQDEEEAGDRAAREEEARSRKVSLRHKTHRTQDLT
ncbi:hypothetical protein H0H93_001240 [Arthromyces matolae]|nr:hypothetical protein H0H93_001240 [Arthromyces matolae]